MNDEPRTFLHMIDEQNQILDAIRRALLPVSALAWIGIGLLLIQGLVFLLLILGLGGGLIQILRQFALR
jgi:hypothetical protein